MLLNSVKANETKSLISCSYRNQGSGAKTIVFPQPPVIVAPLKSYIRTLRNRKLSGSP